MSRISEIKEAIEALPEEDYIQLRQWLSKKDWENWDKQIEADSEAEKMDFLIKEALDEKAKGKLKEL